MKVIVSGRGGHGVQFLAMLLAKTAVHEGKHVTLIKSYGPEARGGASQASVVIEEKPITNPVVKKADYLLAFGKEAVDMWGPRSKSVIYHEDMNNMEMLGIFLKAIGEKLEPVIDTMKSEISAKYAGRLEGNIEKLKRGYENS